MKTIIKQLKNRLRTFSKFLPFVLAVTSACPAPVTPLEPGSAGGGGSAAQMCSAALLTWTDDEHRCSGPWVYNHYECWREARRERFGVESASRGGQGGRPRRCRLACFGVERWEEVPPRHSWAAREFYMRAGDGSWSQRPADLKDLLWRSCQRFAQSLENSERRAECLDEGEEARIYEQVEWDHSQHPPTLRIVEGITYSIRVTRPIFHERESPLCGLTTGSEPIFRLGRCRSAGLEPTNVCAVAQERRYGEPGGLVDDLPPEDAAWWQRNPDGAQCSSCEGSANMSERAACLFEQLQHSRADDRPANELQNLHRRLQLAFEMAEDALPGAIHAEVRALTSRTDSEALCGRKVAQEWSAPLTELAWHGAHPEMNAFAAVNLCQRLAQPHASSRLAGHYADFCAKSLPAIQSALTEQGLAVDACLFREWSVEQIAAIMAKALRVEH